MAGRRISEVEVIETAGGNVVLRVVVRLSDANTDSAEAMVEKISKRKSCRTEKGKMSFDTSELNAYLYFRSPKLRSVG